MMSEGTYTHDDIAAYFKLLLNAWQPLKNSLRTATSPHILRSLQQITRTCDTLQELLWITPTNDKSDIRYQADTLMRDVDAVSESISLKGLVLLPNANKIFAASNEFYTLCADFQKSAHEQDTDLESLRWDFRMLDVAWIDLKAMLAPLNSPDAVPRVTVIDNSVAELRKVIGLQPTTNYEQTVELGQLARQSG